MIRLLIPVILIFLISISLYSQERIQFILPQNILNQGQNVNLIIASTSEDQIHAVTIDIISTSTFNVVKSFFVKTSPSPKNYQINLTNNEEGTYIIHAYLRQAEGNEVIESHMHLFHLLNEGITDKYMKFKTENSKVYHDLSNNQSSSVIKREKLFRQNNDSSIVFAIDENYLYKPSFKISGFSGLADQNSKYFFADKNINNIYACYPESKKTTKLNAGKNVGYLEINQESNEGFYLFDIFNSIKVEWQPDQLSYTHLKEDLVIMSSEDISYINSLALNAGLAKKISYLLEDPKSENLASEPIKINSDNFYEQSLYPEFENISLFLKEVIYPSKTIKSKNNNLKREIILLSGVDKKWYSGKSLLIINGLPENDHEVFLQMKWKDLESVRLYRKIETLRNYYGPLGKNGVIEVVTKNRQISSDLIKPMFLTQESMFWNDPTDPKAAFMPLQFIGKNTQFYHGDRNGKFKLIEVSGDKVSIIKTYEVNN